MKLIYAIILFVSFSAFAAEPKEIQGYNDPELTNPDTAAQGTTRPGDSICYKCGGQYTNDQNNTGFSSAKVAVLPGASTLGKDAKGAK